MDSLSKQEINLQLQKQIDEEFSFDDLVDFSSNDEAASSIAKNAVSEGTATQTGLQTHSLQSAMENYASAMNRSAIAQSTGRPVMTPTQAYKGFAAEEYFKHTLKINALAKGVPDWKIGIYTKGKMPDGSILSGIDMETDIAIWTRKHPWDKPMRTVNYQSKIHNKASAYAKDLNNPQYQKPGLKFVGGKNQGVNDTISVDIGRRTVSSDANTPEAFAELADRMKAQDTPAYAKSEEKFRELHKINMGKAIAAGAMTGLTISTIQEIIGIIKNGKELSLEQFTESIKNILCGTMDGAVRSGAITGSVQLLGKMIGREVAANTLEAVPVMVAANVAVDLAKNLYKCFITQEIDVDDLLCNSINSVFTSAAGFGGAFVAGQIGGQIAGQISSHALIQSISLFASAKTAAAAGASIGSTLGPIGTIVGSVVGGIVIGIGANAIVGTANKDAQRAFAECIAEINSHIELSGCERLYYFADSMESISEFRLSFKDLLPCYNLISDLKEYNIRKKAIKSIDLQMANCLSSIENEKQKMLLTIKQWHEDRIHELEETFAEQKMVMFNDFRESVNAYVANSYMQYCALYEVLYGNINEMLEELELNKTVHSTVLNFMQHRNEINEQLNKELTELLEDPNCKALIEPFLEKLTWFMQQDELLVGRQYLSFDEALYLIDRRLL